MDPKTITYFVVEIGGAEFYFEQLQQASDFFAKLASTQGEKMSRIGWGDSAYHYKDGRHTPEMRQKTVEVYPTREAAEFAKHKAEPEDKE